MTEDKCGTPGNPAARLSQLREGGKRPVEPPLAEAEEIEAEADEPFSMRSADHRQKIMLELRKEGGDAIALAYSYLVRADLDPSKEIVLDFSAYEVRIAGRNLRPLFAGIVAQRVASVQERDELQAEATQPTGTTVVTRIDVRPRE